jgi:hypothetical protein
MAQSSDKQILWVVLLAAVFWIAMWQHELVTKWAHEFLAPVTRQFGTRSR